MDFQRLAQILPKLTKSWTVQDTLKWIDFTGLQSHAQQFKQLGIDGSCLQTLTEQDFRNELGITSKIKMKKIMNWVNTGFSSFDNYLKENRMTMSMKKSITNSKIFGSFPHIQQKIQESPEVYQKRQATHTENKKNYQHELIVKQSQVAQTNNYSFKNSGGTIGRNANNAIVVYDQFVSRYHAEIIYQEGQFFIKDCGSNSGTFFRITEKKELYDGIVLEMGSNQFQVDLSDSQKLGLSIIDGPNYDFYFVIPKKDKITMGRKPHNQVNFPDDHHLSNIHSAFFHVNGIWYVQDLGSTNGTWVRLSKAGAKSSKWKLQDKSQFKISTNFTYQCRLNGQNRKTEKQRSYINNDKCNICKQEDRNAIVLPCKHNTCCYKCMTTNNIEICDSCGVKINDIVKIFKV